MYTLQANVFVRSIIHCRGKRATKYTLLQKCPSVLLLLFLWLLIRLALLEQAQSNPSFAGAPLLELFPVLSVCLLRNLAGNQNKLQVEY